MILRAIFYPATEADYALGDWLWDTFAPWLMMLVAAGLYLLIEVNR